MKTKSPYFNLRLLSRYSEIFTVSSAIFFICLRKWLTRISKTSKIKY